MTKVFKGNTLHVARKLRLVANAKRNVNILRAEHSAALRVSLKKAAARVSPTPVRGERPHVGTTTSLFRAYKKLTLDEARGKLAELAEDIGTNVFATLVDDTDLTSKRRPFVGVTGIETVRSRSDGNYKTGSAGPTGS